ncbi:MAG: hypothetical protein IAF94_13275, partial [Pirellulaceae bacterium]|nr:hypothetical protein [Pirellulaceae bacterium]
MTLWEVDIHPAPGEPDLLGRSTAAQAHDLGLGDLSIQAARGFLVQGDLSAADIERLANELFADLVVERPVVGKVGDDALSSDPAASSGRAAPSLTLIHVL